MNELRFTQLGLIYGFSFALGMIWFDNADPDCRDPDAVPVVVAVKDLPVGTLLKNPDDWLTVKRYRGGTGPAHTVRCLWDFRDQVTARTIERGQPCTARDVVPDSCWKPAPDGYRAFTIRLDGPDAEFAKKLPGNRVDLLCTGQFLDGIQQTWTVTFLENVQVLAVNCFWPGPNAAGIVCSPRTVTLAVKPEETSKLVWANSLGSIALALRRPGDEEIVKPRPFGGFFPLVVTSESSDATR